ncbi:unnamed protein product [Brassica rapa]|uniref:Uncharacterized protein n=1 Tax=Brassica campestris TaxID=3711 RepID=A0A3P6BYU5_BRACM|nr:unnamed protein product [Brassica rapa]VDD11487.1 unnamed protein product [Brassica rapa]
MRHMQNSVQQICRSQAVVRQNSYKCAKHLDDAKKMQVQKAVQENLHGVSPEVIDVEGDPTDGARKEKRDESKEQEQNALGLYRGDGAVVPYEIKGEKPKAKVQLDDETTRLWTKLLMGKGDKNGDEDMNKSKEKWWEEERKVFRGRVDSYNVCMQLVQGKSPSAF